MSGYARRSRNFFKDLMNWNTTGNEDSIKPEFVPVADLSNTVYGGIVANGTTIATTTVLKYGVNSVVTVTNTNNSAKLPQPAVGKSVKVVNLGSNPLILFPSNSTSKIGTGANGVNVVVPADGKVYEFVCLDDSTNSVWTANNTPAALPYKSYIVYITTTGSNTVPTIDETIENTIGNIAWTYQGVGVYRLALNNAFPVDKTVATITNCVTALGYATFDAPTGGSGVELRLFDPTGTPDDSVILSGAIIEIKVYY